jgi:hypothetical protein
MTDLLAGYITRTNVRFVVTPQRHRFLSFAKRIFNFLLYSLMPLFLRLIFLNKFYVKIQRI